MVKQLGSGAVKGIGGGKGASCLESSRVRFRDEDVRVVLFLVKYVTSDLS